MKNLFNLLIALLLLSSCSQKNATPLVDSVAIKENNVSFYLNDLDNEFNAMFITDCHITIEDERGEEFYKYSKRMGGEAAKPENYGKSNGREAQLLASLEKARKMNAEIVILAGDIINYPSEASVEFIKKIMDESKLKWMFITGNHDWHYEGMDGSSSDLRSKWVPERLLPLYQGANPMYASQIVNGINFVLIDNSTNEITPEQLQFFKEQTLRSEPIVLAMHIPLYTCDAQDPGNFGCGHPKWNAKNDDYYKIERRQPWRESGHNATTLEFRELVFDTPSLLGVFAGHTHVEEFDFYRGKPQIINGANFMGSDISIKFISASK